MNGLRRDDRRQVLRDVVLWVLLAIVISAMGPDPLRDLGAFCAITVPRLALGALAVLVGRPWPLAAVVLLLPLGPWDFADSLATSDITWLIPGAIQVKIFPFAPVSPFSIWYAYLAGRRLPRALPWSIRIPGAGLVAVLITAIGVVLVVAGGGAAGLWITMVSGLIGTYLVPYLLGLLRRRLLQQRDQARQAAEAQARLRERARIARDMHDSLGHDLALIAVRAAGLELSPTLEPAHARAASELRAAAADATERLRQIIGVLREDTDAAPLAPTTEEARVAITPHPPARETGPVTPSVPAGEEDVVAGAARAGDDVASPPTAGDDAEVREDVVALVERARDSGMAITLRLERPIPGLAHRVVQEGLTNVAKHAPGAVIEVAVTPHLVAVRNGPPAHAPQVTATGGFGLPGLRERVRLAGGTLRAGPADGGYELAAELP
ncbi:MULTISPECIES: sensor histidine kinase [Nonomuraea]|uniref:histidine kinase n=2 Tax=Nonomuraea ferruginea TaxID=46174 RepID=A0ABT4T8W9_9ACTN|nr:sensor histidine kinase [Nonomuraea ferruginea]MDA0645895.1 histidine kinase [Nonomuraea ferruginea]